MTFVMWDSYETKLRAVAEEEGLDIRVFTKHKFENMRVPIEDAVESIRESDVTVLYKTGQPYWSDLVPRVEELMDRTKILSFGSDPLDFAMTSVEPRLAIECYKYLINGGEENTRRMVRFLMAECLGMEVEYLPPEEVPWHGIFHPDAEGIFTDTKDYLEWYDAREGAPWVGIVGSRSSWVNDGLTVETEVIRQFENLGANVITVFTNSVRNEERGSINIADAVEKYLLDEDGNLRVSALVKTIMFVVGRTEARANRKGVPPSGAQFFKSLNVPVFQPVVASNMSRERFQEVPGLTSDVSWCIALPEFEGVIEPTMLGFSREREDSEASKTVDPGRAKRLAERVLNRIELGRKPNSEKKIAFILNNFPCAGVEANVGGASNLDTHQSMANILGALNAEGYDVRVPEDGKAIITEILEKKAISEFRWTTAEAISDAGGVFHYMTVGEYMEFFDTLSDKVKADVIGMWGEPPGKGMVLDGDILITGVSFGNAMIAVQPKRGCFGARCDGEVCKILHDPLCPPTHQYLATYFFYEEKWGADAIMHVGTHGNLEFLPGKTAGMTGDCYPDIGIGRAPHIYIYNADNPPEGTIAKRRSLATLVSHMQTVMASSGLYAELEALDKLLEQYDGAKTDPSREHQFRHLLEDAIAEANLSHIDAGEDTPTEEVVRLCHEELSKVRNSQTNIGMHIFGEYPEGDDKADMVYSIMRYDSGSGTIRDAVAESYGLTLKDLYASQGSDNARFGMPNGKVIEFIGEKSREVIGHVLDGMPMERAAAEAGLPPAAVEPLLEYEGTILDIGDRISGSREIEALLNALNGGYTEPGPSGLITRGRHDVLPTGKNFYSLDPHRVPTEPSWRVGAVLAEELIKKHVEETGAPPDNVAFFWMSNDIMAADGEVMAQIMHLIGVKPVWSPNGQVHSYEVIPLGELGRPRVDVTVRTSGILRDNFMNCIDLIDKAVREVAALDEPTEMNFIRKHVQRDIADGVSEEDSTARLFCAPPGSYVSAVNLAVYASSWKTKDDLAKMYIAANGYAYGGERNGAPMHEQFARDLSTVSVTYNKIASDERDLLGCCCYFSNHGGLTAASEYMSGREVKTYYGDTREPNDINVHDLADEIRRVVRTKLLNPKWIEGMKEHGYKGAADMMKRIVRVYGFDATTDQVDDWIFDDIANTFVNDEEMKEFYKENNPYALEEIARRLLEAEQRGIWDADEETLEELRSNYVDIESWMEELAGDGEYQGGSVDILTPDDVAEWKAILEPVLEKIGRPPQV
ncbi:MAG: cobaltochelatase subunit CobN [Thermoplasmatales archaeon]|nr:cobaltochelatase subunit CobN [Thermoplasmatales archaeon]